MLDMCMYGSYAGSNCWPMTQFIASTTCMSWLNSFEVTTLLFKHYWLFSVRLLSGTAFATWNMYPIYFCHYNKDLLAWHNTRIPICTDALCYDVQCPGSLMSSFFQQWWTIKYFTIVCMFWICYYANWVISFRNLHWTSYFIDYLNTH